MVKKPHLSIVNVWNYIITYIYIYNIYVCIPDRPAENAETSSKILSSRLKKEVIFRMIDFPQDRVTRNRVKMKWQR